MLLLFPVGLIEVGMGIHGESGREQVTLPQDDAAKTVAGILIDVTNRLFVVWK